MHQNVCCTWQSCCFANLSPLRFWRFRCRHRRRHLNLLRGRTIRKVMGGGVGGEFSSRRNFFFVIKFLVWNFFRLKHKYFLGLIGVHEFFSFHFPLANIFFALGPSPPSHNKFSNGPLKTLRGFLVVKQNIPSEYLSWLVRKLWFVWKWCCLSIKVIFQPLVGVMSASEHGTHNYGI